MGWGWAEGNGEEGREGFGVLISQVARTDPNDDE